MVVRKKLSPEQIRLRMMRSVGFSSPSFGGINLWSLEVTFIDAAALYEFGGESPLTDEQWDALGRYLGKLRNVSPYFRHCVDMKALRKKPTTLVINWRSGLGRASLEYWKHRLTLAEDQKPLEIQRSFKIKQRPAGFTPRPRPKVRSVA